MKWRIFFGNYAAVAANMPNRKFRAPNVVSERSKTLVLAKSYYNSLKLFALAKTFKTFCFSKPKLI